MNSESDLFHGIVNERLKFVDILLKGGRVDEAFQEITEIRALDATNPYAHAYEERIKAIRTSPNVGVAGGGRAAMDHTFTSQPGTYPQNLMDVHASQMAAEPSSTHGVSIVQDVHNPEPQVVDFPGNTQCPQDRRDEGKANIVLVDDDELLLMALVELFQDNGYTANYFTKAEDALQFLKGHTPDLVLCDVNLSKSAFGGFTLLEKMEKLGHLHKIPFIFMSGLRDEVIVRAGKEAGADDYLTKPMEPEMLLSVVKGKLRKYRMMQRNRAE